MRVNRGDALQRAREGRPAASAGGPPLRPPPERCSLVSAATETVSTPRPAAPAAAADTAGARRSTICSLFSAAITTENRNKLTAARAGRLRTDLGGLYFNLIGILALAGLYAATNAEILLLAIAVIQLEMLE